MVFLGDCLYTKSLVSSELLNSSPALRLAVITDPAMPELQPDDAGLPAAFAEHGVETVVLGGACATIAFVVGRFVASFAGEVMLD